MPLSRAGGLEGWRVCELAGGGVGAEKRLLRGNKLGLEFWCKAETAAGGKEV